jgi:hypothetical protein
VASFIGEGTGIPGENNRPVTSYWQTLSHKVVSFKPTKLTIWKVYSKYWPTTRQFLPMSHKNNLKFLHKVQDHREKTKFDSRRVSLVEQELLTLPEYPSSPSVFSGVRVTRSLVLCVMFCRSFVFFFWPLCCLFFFDIPILITSLVSSNSSWPLFRSGVMPVYIVSMSYGQTFFFFIIQKLRNT